MELLEIMISRQTLLSPERRSAGSVDSLHPQMRWILGSANGVADGSFQAATPAGKLETVQCPANAGPGSKLRVAYYALCPESASGGEEADAGSIASGVISGDSNILNVDQQELEMNANEACAKMPSTSVLAQLTLLQADHTQLVETGCPKYEQLLQQLWVSGIQVNIAN